MAHLDPGAFLQGLFAQAVASAQPDLCLPPHLPEPPRGRLIVIGAGKGAASMAKSVEDHWPGPLSGWPGARLVRKVRVGRASRSP
jgi:hydroxypyruvate reductase